MTRNPVQVISAPTFSSFRSVCGGIQKFYQEVPAWDRWAEGFRLGFRVRDLASAAIKHAMALYWWRSTLSAFDWEERGYVMLSQLRRLEDRTPSSKPECSNPVVRYLQVTQYDVGDSYELHRDSSIEAMAGPARYRKSRVLCFPPCSGL